MEAFKSPAEKGKNSEAEAEEKLDEILSDADFAFIGAHPKNMDRIDNAETAVEALAIARELISARAERTFTFTLSKAVEGVEAISVNVEGVKRIIESIKENQQKIGEGGDAYVVIDKNELKEFPPEICYKFAKKEETPRGRNSMSGEADIHGDFYTASLEVPELGIGVPSPLYSTEVGKDKILAMEKLPAKSVDDILRGMGTLRNWFDVDEFCDRLSAFLTQMHERGLYHRDMHVGNVMINQSAEMPEDGNWGYVIDFGLSSHGIEGMDPYKKEVAGTRFTYNDDHGIVEEVRQKLHGYQARNNKGV